MAFGSRRLLGLDSLLQPVTLDARNTAAGDDPNTAAVEIFVATESTVRLVAYPNASGFVLTIARLTVTRRAS